SLRAGLLVWQVRQAAAAQLVKPVGQFGPHPLDVLDRSVGGQGGSVFALRQGRGLLSQSRHGQNIFIVALNTAGRNRKPRRRGGGRLSKKSRPADMCGWTGHIQEN